MNKAKINELYEKAYVTYEVPYESSVVDPTIVSIHKQRVWDRHLFAELIVDEVYDYILNATFDDEPWPDRKDVKKHFGVEK